MPEPITAPDFADKIAADLLKRYLLESIAFDVDQQQIVGMLLGIAAREGYMLGLGVTA